MPDSTDYLNRLWGSGSVLIRPNPFTLKSGRESHIYANHRNLICLPDNLALFAELIGDILRSRFPYDVSLASVDSVPSPSLAAVCSLRHSIPLYSYRQSTNERGVSDEVFGYDRNLNSPFPPSLPAVLVDDVVTTNSTLDRATHALRSAGIDVRGAVCVLDRRPASLKGTALLDVHSIATLKVALLYGIESQSLSPETTELIHRELRLLESPEDA